MSRKKRKAQAAEVPDIEASGKDMYDWVQCLIVALIICVVFFAFFVFCLGCFFLFCLAWAGGFFFPDGVFARIAEDQAAAFRRGFA